MKQHVPSMLWVTCNLFFDLRANMHLIIQSELIKSSTINLLKIIIIIANKTLNM